MPATHRHHDLCTGHGCWPSRPNVQASGDVFINNKGAHRRTDDWAAHCCGGCHGGNLAKGSPTVFVNGLDLARIGDPVDCGSFCMTGSGDVFADDVVAYQ